MPPTAPKGDVLTSPAFLAKAPEIIKRPCDFGLETAVRSLEVQIGTIEAYNRLAAAAAVLRSRIDAGDIKEPVPGVSTPA